MRALNHVRGFLRSRVPVTAAQEFRQLFRNHSSAASQSKVLNADVRRCTQNTQITTG
jgi:hypothetical protein